MVWWSKHHTRKDVLEGQATVNIDFYKIRIYRSDYVLIHPSVDTEIQPDKTGYLARTLCGRRKGVGANGLIVMWGRGSADLKLEFFDRFGELVSPPGDAILCATRFAFDSGRIADDTVRFLTGTSIRNVRAIDSSSFRINMGAPVSPIDEKELNDTPNREHNSSILLDNRWLSFTPIRCVRDFSVVFGKTKRNAMKRLDERLSGHVASEGMQPVFVRVLSPDDVRMYTWFHGQSSDYAATAGAAVVAAVANGFTESTVSAHFGEETYFVQWVHRTNRVFVTGTPAYVFTGTIYIE